MCSIEFQVLREYRTHQGRYPLLRNLSLSAIKVVIVPDIVKNAYRTRMDGIDETQFGKSFSREK